MQLDLIGGSEKEKQIQFGGVGKGKPVKSKQPAASLFIESYLSVLWQKHGWANILFDIVPQRPNSSDNVCIFDKHCKRVSSFKRRRHESLGSLQIKF